MTDFIVGTLLPIIILLLLGWWFFRQKIINEGFIDSGSKLVFNAALPSLLFLSISQTTFNSAVNNTLILIGTLGTFVYFLLLMAFCHLTIKSLDARSVVIQGGFRSNMGIIGLAFCANTYGSQGTAIASIYLGCVTILFNILSAFVLNFYNGGKLSLMQHFRTVIMNPLIISILVALPFSYYQIPLPEVVITTGEYFAKLTLPLALICTGASLQFRSFKADWLNISVSSVSKCLLYPLVMVSISYLAGFRGVSLGVVLFLSIAPTAATSYVMARNLGGDYRLAASIIVITTLLSLPVTAIAFGTLNALGLL